MKYLPECGIAPIVLTRATAAGAILDPGLLAEVAHAPCCRVPMPIDLASIGQSLARARWVGSAKTPSANGNRNSNGTRHGLLSTMLSLRDLLMFPDHMAIAVPAFRKTAQKLVLENNIRAICTSGPHHSLHLVGLWLKRRLRIPCWITDFRDAWVTDPKMTFPTRLHRWANEQMESAVVRAADKVVTVSEHMRRDFLNRYPDLSPGKFHTIYNGYDEADFQDTVPSPFSTDRLHILHTGTIYERAGVESVIGCLGQVLAEDRGLADRIRVELLGQVHPAAQRSIDREIANWKLDPVIRFHGCLPHSETVSRMLAASGLLLITGPGREVVTTKVFEYLRAGMPILAICEPDAEVLQILASAGATFAHVDRNKLDQVREALRAWCRTLADVNGSNGQSSGRPPATFSRVHAAREFTRLIRSVWDSRKEGCAG